MTEENKPVKIEDYGNDLVKLIKEMGIVLDYTEIAKAELKRSEIPTMSVMSAPMYIKDFNEACANVSRLLIKVRLAFGRARAARKAEEAKAVLERAPKYFEEKGTLKSMKDSTALRNHYVNIDEGFQRAYDKYKALEALEQFLVDKLDEFKRDFYSVKQIHGGMIGDPSTKTGYDGIKSN